MYEIEAPLNLYFIGVSVTLSATNEAICDPSFSQTLAILLAPRKHKSKIFQWHFEQVHLHI